MDRISVKGILRSGNDNRFLTSLDDIVVAIIVVVHKPRTALLSHSLMMLCRSVGTGLSLLPRQEGSGLFPSHVLEFLVVLGNFQEWPFLAVAFLRRTKVQSSDFSGVAALLTFICSKSNCAPKALCRRLGSCASSRTMAADGARHLDGNAQ